MAIGQCSDVSCCKGRKVIVVIVAVATVIIVITIVNVVAIVVASIIDGGWCST